MSVRKRKWTTRSGEVKEAWIVDYVDQVGDRHIETFKKKKQADAYADQTGVDLRAGTSTVPGPKVTRGSATADTREARPRTFGPSSSGCSSPQ